MFIFYLCLSRIAVTSEEVVNKFLSRHFGVVLGSYVRGMSLVARAHNVQLKLTRPIQVHVTIELNIVS